MGQSQYNDVVFKAMALIRANPGKALSVPEIAKETGFSERYLRNAFKAVLNQSVVGAIQAEKIKRAKNLLLETSLDIGDVAFEAGFNNHTNFSKVFQNKAGLSPTEFRKKALQLREIPSAHTSGVESNRNEAQKEFKDCFSQAGLGPNWTSIRGVWRNENGIMLGTGSENTVVFLKPLPENCRISFEVFIDPIPELGGPDTSLELVDEFQKNPYCSFVVATAGKAAGQLRYCGEERKWNTESRISESEWHELTLEIRDDTLRFWIDGREAFSFRDSFPPPYSARCYMRLATWHCDVRVRNFVVADLGFTPAAHPIKQGDALYNAGLYANAMDFYTRLLKSGSASDVETMELRYKIGMCALRQNSYATAQSWIDKVVGLREEKFWSEQAGLALLEIAWRMGEFDRFQEHLKLRIGDSKTRDSARVIVQFAAEDLLSRGFLKKSSWILELWYDLEAGDTIARQMIEAVLAELHLKAREFEKTEQVLVNIIHSSRFADARMAAQVNLMQLYFEWGKPSESERVRLEIEESTHDPFTRARSTLHKAMIMREQGNMNEALDLLVSMKKLFPLEDMLAAHAKIQASHILCCLGRRDEALVLFEEAKSEAPHYSIRIKHTVPMFVMTDRFLEGGEALFAEYSRNKNDTALIAETGVKAGILFELAGRPEEARKIFVGVSERFPPEKVCFYGSFAQALAANAAFSIADMPYDHLKRSEMFYLFGLLKERRGEPAEARSLYSMSISEDPTLRWPVYFSRKKLGQQPSNCP